MTAAVGPTKYLPKASSTVWAQPAGGGTADDSAASSVSSAADSTAAGAWAAASKAGGESSWAWARTTAESQNRTGNTTCRTAGIASDQSKKNASAANASAGPYRFQRGSHERPEASACGSRF